MLNSSSHKWDYNRVIKVEQFFIFIDGVDLRNNYLYF